MDTLRKRHVALIDGISGGFVRYLYHRLPWTEQLVGIKGSRGVGKTTLLLQFIKQTYGQNPEALYVSLDDMYFADNKLIELADNFVAKGGKHLFIDEVHKYKNWAIEIKKIYDYHPNLQVVFTGSSLLEILNARSDLSRRALVYTMQGLSYREYLLFNDIIELQSYNLSDIIENHTEISLKIAKKIKPLRYFEDYLRHGYFPFYKQNETLYFKRLNEILNMIMEIELPYLRSVDIANVSKLRKLLYVISRSVPFKPNISALAQKINTSRNSLLEYIRNINDAGIINVIFKDSFGVSLLQKPDKIYLENTNFIYTLSEGNSNIGNLRETFFLNQLLQNHTVTYPKTGDFMVDDRYLFEVGGHNKTQKQIAGQENAFLVKDDIEYGYENTIPLWLFGFLY